MTPQKTGAGPSRPTPKTITAPSGRNGLYHGQSLRRQPIELLDRGPPKDVDAERAVLAVILLDPRRIGEAVAALEPSDFADDAHCTIYGAMIRLHRRGQPPDATRLCGELRDADEYEAERGVSAGAMMILYRLFPLASSLQFYLARVAEMSRRRHALERGIRLIQAAHNADTGPSISPAIRRATQHAIEHRARIARKGGGR